jgi:hypothetical protein
MKMRTTRVIREWGTPLTIGSFIVMAVTGGLMFFHSAVALNGLLHRWSGLVMIAAVALHTLANWPSIERYLKQSNLARALIGLGALVLIGSFVNWWGYPGKSEGNVYRAVMGAPAGHVAMLNGLTFEQLRARLAPAGITLTSPDETLDQATAGDRDLQDKVVLALFVRN